MQNFLQREISFPIHFLLINITCFIGPFLGIWLPPPILSMPLSIMLTLTLEPVVALVFIFMRFAGWPYYTTNTMTNEINFLSLVLQTEVFYASIASLSTYILAWITLWHFIRGINNPKGGANGRLIHHKWMLFGAIGTFIIYLIFKKGAGAILTIAISLA